MHDGVGIHPVSLEDPIVATYLIQRYYNRSRKGMLDQKKNLCKKNYNCRLLGGVLAVGLPDHPQCLFHEVLTLGLLVGHPLAYGLVVHGQALGV